MFKLNEKGWGYGFLFFFAALFILILVGAAIAISNITKNNKDSESSDSKKNYDRVYVILEEKLKNSGDYYVANNEEYFNKKSGSTKMTVAFLKNKGYIDDIIDPVDNSSCDGFVIVYANKEVKSYIKCSKYKTENYDSWS